MASLEELNNLVQQLQKKLFDNSQDILTVEKNLTNTQQELAQTNQQLQETKQELEETKQELQETKQQLQETKQKADTTIKVLTHATSIEVDFVNYLGYSELRNELLNPKNFGSSGTVKYEISLLPSVANISAQLLAEVEIVLIVQPSSVTDAEKELLKDFVEDGGNLFVFGNEISSFASTFGATPGNTIGGGNPVATVVNGESPIANGPFGTLPAGSTFKIQAHGFLGGVGENGSVIFRDNPGNNIFGATFKIGKGKVVMIGDEECFLNPGQGVHSAPSLSPSSKIVFLNTFAYFANKKNLFSIEEKFILTLMEVQALTGFNRQKLKDALAYGELKGKKINGDWRIKRSDLNEFKSKF